MPFKLGVVGSSPTALAFIIFVRIFVFYKYK
jgi:hypothetical protein